MKNLLYDVLDSGVAVFMDDILIYSRKVKEHFMLLKKYWHAYVNIHSTVGSRSVASYATVQNSLVLILHLKVCTSVT